MVNNTVTAESEKILLVKSPQPQDGPYPGPER